MVSVRLATLDDAPAIRTIYNVEVTGHTSTFDLVPRTLDEQRAWLADRSGAFSAVVATLRDEPDVVVGFRLAVAVQGTGRVPHDRRELGLRVARAQRARASAPC